MPEDIAWKLLEIGRVIDPLKTAAIYVPLQEKEPYSGVKIERDVKYGAADRNRLDIFMPETASSPRPVLIFVHGGAFVSGDKRGRGRDEDCSSPPAQIPASAANAPGSSLGFWRRNGDRAADVVS